MKKFLLGIAVLIITLSFVTTLSAIDLVEDEAFLNVLNSDKFTNVVIDYQFEGKQYPIRIIYNPQKEMLWGNEMDEPSSISLILIANLPVPLERYIEDLVLEMRGSYEDCQLILRHGSPNSKYGWTTTEVIHLATSINDSINDEIVNNTFKSKRFKNKVIYYKLGKEFYQVRLLHNPEEKTFTDTHTYDLTTVGPTKITTTWKKKYAILFDIEAPQKLVDHLSNSLRSLTYWEWFFSYTLSNGTYVEYAQINYNRTITWSLDPWFFVTQDFHE